MSEKKLNDRDLDDFLSGALILGTGGGGGIDWGKNMLNWIKEHDKIISIIDPQKIPQDALIVGAAGVGGGITKEEREKIEKKFGPLPGTSAYLTTSIMADKMMVGHFGEDISAYLAFELGCGNTVLPACIAAMNNKPLVDGDCNGRAVPEIELCTLNVCGFPFTPIAIVTPYSETMLVTHVYDYSRAEDICRAMAVVSGGGCMTMGSPIRGKDLSKSIVKNSVSGSIKLGQSIRESNDKGKDPVEAAVKALGGNLLFRGKIKQFQREERGGFMWGEHNYEGTGDFSNHKFRVVYKNENLLSWLDGLPYVTCPDLICVLDAKDGKGLSNWGNDFITGREVAVIGYKIDPIWRTKRGLEIFSPAHFGYDIKYRPIENVVTKP
ncbi:MAG: DUF917 domain-containing protein [Candidatus Bathyarchaeia archaeon]|jgi:DUF917 family protein